MKTGKHHQSWRETHAISENQVISVQSFESKALPARLSGPTDPKIIQFVKQ